MTPKPPVTEPPPATRRAPISRSHASHDRTLVRVGARTLELSNLEKVLYPGPEGGGFTKGQVIDYYQRIAKTIVPHLKDRPVTLKRYPNGIDHPFFYEKRCPSYKPDWLTTATLWSKHNKADLVYCTLNEPAAVVWAANLASIELHPLLATGKNPDRPTYIAFDFDPGPPAGRLEAANVLLMVHGVMEHLGLEAFPKVSGGKGMHLYVPLNTAITFDETKAFAESLARLFERDHPDLITANMLKSKRNGRVFMDWSQNDAHKTTVCVYSLRARARPTVSAPVTWEEIHKAVRKSDPQLLEFSPQAVLERVARDGDLFAPVLKKRQKLPSGA